MKTRLCLLFISLFLSGCLFHTHKVDIEQGNILSEKTISRLKIGMSEAEVKAIMGTPILNDIFSINKLSYVYTLQNGYQPMEKKRLICLFERGRLKQIMRQ